MGRGPEQRPDLRRFARTALLGMAVVGGAATVGAEVDFHLNTAPKQIAIIDNAIATRSDASKIIRETGLEERADRDLLIFLAGALLLSVPTLIFLDRVARKGSVSGNNILLLKHQPK